MPKLWKCRNCEHTDVLTAFERSYNEFHDLEDPQNDLFRCPKCEEAYEEDDYYTEFSVCNHCGHTDSSSNFSLRTEHDRDSEHYNEPVEECPECKEVEVVFYY